MIGGFTSYVLFASGWVLFGLASIRARVFPLPISIAIVVSGIVGFQAALPPFAIPLAVTIGLLGAWMIGSTARQRSNLVTVAPARAEAGRS
jgi:hypothetical protein